MIQSQFFEDFMLGSTRETLGRTITEADIVLHAGQTGDFYPHHMDAEWCKTQDFKQRIAHGTLIFSVAVGMTAGKINPEAFSYGYDRLRFIKPVFIGDTIHVRVSVKEKREHKKPSQGIVSELVEVFNQRNEIVLACEHLLLVQEKIMKPLEGLLVLDFSQFLAGPSAAMRLADLGARVIKIERPGTGDICRQLYITNLKLDGDSTLFHSINRNKQSYAADLKNPTHLAQVKKLVSHADVLIQNFRPGVMERLGLGYDDVAKAQPQNCLRHRYRLRSHRPVGRFAGTGFACPKPKRPRLVERRRGSSAHADGTFRVRPGRERASGSGDSRVSRSSRL